MGTLIEPNPANSSLIDMGQRKPDQKVVIFLHIPKAGGTTLHGIINQQYVRAATFRFDGINSRHQLNALSVNQRAELRLIRGHMAFGLHQFLSCPATYFTILRNPITRFISRYHYIRRSPDVHPHENREFMNLRDYIISQGVSQSNIQTRMILGLSKPEPGEDMLTVAKRNLRQHFAVVGLMEEFDETLVLLKNAFQWRTPVYVQQNITSKKQYQTEEISAEMLALIEQHNQLDIQLYQYAKEQFSQQVQALGSTFGQDLKTQRMLNSLYQPVGKTYGLARQLALHLMQHY